MQRLPIKESSLLEHGCCGSKLTADFLRADVVLNSGSDISNMTVVHAFLKEPQAQAFPVATSLVQRRHSAGDDGFSRRPRCLPDFLDPRNPPCARSRLSDRYQRGDVCIPWTSRFTSNANLSPARSPFRLFDQFLDLRCTIHNLKNQISQAHLRWHYEQEQLSNMFRVHLESAQELNSSLEKAIEFGRSTASFSKTSQLDQRCSKSLRDIEVQKYICGHFSRELSNLESMLISREGDHDAILARLCGTIGIETEDKQGSLDWRTIFDPDFSELPPLLVEYYHRSGDVGIQEDRLEDLDVEHEQALEGKGCPDHIGDNRQRADDATQRGYEQQRARILAELAAAQHDVGVLAQACQAVGIDTEARRYVYSSEGCSQGEVE